MSMGLWRAEIMYSASFVSKVKPCTPQVVSLNCHIGSSWLSLKSPFPSCVSFVPDGSAWSSSGLLSHSGPVTHLLTAMQMHVLHSSAILTANKERKRTSRKVPHSSGSHFCTKHTLTELLLLIPPEHTRNRWINA